MTDGIEKFEITDWDLENEFNPNRVRHKLTKKQQIYGVFGGDDSDEDVRPSFSSKGKKDFTAPISFISGGIRQVGKKDNEKKEDSEEKGSSSDDDVPAKASVEKQKNSTNKISGFSGSYKPSQLAGLRASQGNMGSEFGSWEKHTKGIGQKLLQKMGYEPGKGLGKSLQGITAPIEAKKRKGKGALGLYGPERGMNLTSEPSPLVVVESEEEDKELNQHQRQWKKNPGEIKRSVKYVYRTVDEVAKEGSYKKLRGDSTALSRVKVIDMTGPEQRVLSGYHQIHQQHSKPQEQELTVAEPKSSKGYHFALPELMHNLNLLVDMTEQEIVRTDRQLQHEQDRVVSLHHEEDRLVQVLKQEDKQIKTLDKVLKIVESLDEKSRTAENTLTIEETAKTFKELQDNYYEEYKLYNLSDLAITIVVPLVKKLLEKWNPLQEKHHCIDVFQDWKNVLETGESNIISWNKGTDQLDPYHQLVWDVWMPPVRDAILKWNTRECDSLIELLETWMPLLPPWVTSNILEQHVLPQLQKEVESWNPLTDTLPIHSWLHPWLPLMGNRLEPLYGPIRHKLASALVKWHPSDCSAKLILEPWKPVFSQGVMDAFIINNIVPKLAVALQSYVINPHQQHLDVWNWVMAWEDMIPEPCMVTLLEKNFFPKWLQVLCTWLTHNPNYEEVTKWYTGWKSMFSPSLLSSPIIKDQFKQALDIMNRAVSSPQGLLGHQPGAKESMAYLTNVERQQELESHVKPRRDYEAMMQAIRGASSAASLSMSFKDLIEKKAEESNILFMPIAGRYQEGKQVYRFGRIVLYLDRGVIFVYNEKTWVPTSLQSLLDMAG